MTSDVISSTKSFPSSPHDPTNRLISKDRNDYPLAQISRINGQTLVWGGVCQGKCQVRDESIWSYCEDAVFGGLMDSCITQLKAQGPTRTCNESKEEVLHRRCHAAPGDLRRARCPRRREHARDGIYPVPLSLFLSFSFYLSLSLALSLPLVWLFGEAITDDSCITQLEAQGPSRTCNESKEEERRSSSSRRSSRWSSRSWRGTLASSSRTLSRSTSTT